MEDDVIFCMDMEKKLARLSAVEQRLVTRIALQHYQQAEAAAMLGLSLSHAVRRYADALDRLTAMLLQARMLEPLKSCQEGKEVEFCVSV
jgi:DNA-directed RNA polymerase specialized sigma24 family protein